MTDKQEYVTKGITSSFSLFFRNLKPNNGVSLSVYSSNLHGRSHDKVMLETTPSKVAELQIGNTRKPFLLNPLLILKNPL